MEPRADIAVIGLAVMGQNLILNMNDHGFTVAAYNRTVSKVDEFMADEAKATRIIGAHSLEELVGFLKRPRRIMLMVKAGAPVDETIEQLLRLCSPGDVIIDGGNSFFADTIRRASLVEEKGMFYIGAGVSGGEEGARNGPSIMPGGSAKAWPLVKDIFKAIAAKTPDGAPCCEWVGDNGAGHYVKMAHNAIEYGDMQIICEAYGLLKSALRLSAAEMQSIFTQWNTTELNSYLIEITADIFGFNDADGSPLVEKILDAAGQKGTGKWFSADSLDLGVPTTLITEAVYARGLSARKDERVAASKKLTGITEPFSGDKQEFIEDVRRALLASKIVSYAQGFMQMREAAIAYRWNLQFGDIALLWRGGCIIRSAFLDNIKSAFDKNPDLPCLLIDDYFVSLIARCQPSWRRVVAKAALLGIPSPAFASALSFFDGYRCERLPANLLQAQRDYFGAHTYQRIDKPRDRFFHTNWNGRGGEVTSGTYTA